MIEGALAAGGRSGRIEKGRLEGEKIDFSTVLDGARYEFSGRITNHAIDGKVKMTGSGGARELQWSATRVELWEPRHAALTTEQTLKEMH